MADEKLNLMVRIKKDDYDFFNKIQKENKAEGIAGANVFSQFVQAYKKERGIDNA
jgi:hypothetical protein